MEEFERIVHDSGELFSEWSTELTNAKQELRRRNMRIAEISKHREVAKRLEELKRKRVDHERLRKVAKSLATNQSKASSAELAQKAEAILRDIDAAYEEFRQVDAVDISELGNSAWLSARAAYDRKIVSVDRTIAGECPRRGSDCRALMERFTR